MEKDEKIQVALDEESKKESLQKYRELKLRLEEIQKKKRSYPFVIGPLMTAIGFLVFLLLFFYRKEFNVYTIGFSFGYAILMGAVLATYYYLCFELKANRIRQKMIHYEADNIQDKVQEDVFENSIKMSYKYLDQYYLQTREQAQKGFFVTVCISLFGAVLIGIGILAMFLEKTQPSYVTCASGVITEFIAAIFFYLYNKTVTSMSRYHNKLVLSQNISIALKVADTLPSDEKTKSKNMIISELLKDINRYLIKSDSEDKEK